MEAWRKINKRYDPATGSRKGSLLRHILSPAKSKLEDLTGNLEVWLDLISRYENRKDPSGNRVKLQDEIKIAVLEQICPTELERHLQMSKARLKSFEDHREEIMSFLETRLGSKMKIETIASASGKETRQDDPMDVGAVMMKGKGKGKGKFKGKGKGFKGGSKGKGNKGGKQGKGKNNNNNGKGQQSKSSDVCWNCGKSGHHQKDCWSKNGKGGKGGKGGKSKGGAKNGKSVNAVDVQDAPEPETEQSYLELATVERTDMPARAKARANPVLEVPDDFPDVGVSEIVRRLAYQRDVRLTNQGYARGSRPNWREEPVTRYRQRSMAFSEASRMRGSMREVTIKKITEAEGIDQACSSCDERYHASKSSVSKYAAQYVARMYSKRNKSAYDDEEEDSQDESSIDEADDESSGYEPSIAPNDVEEIEEEEEAEASRTYYTNCPGGHGLKIHRTREPGWTCSECRKSYPKNTNLMRCNQCDYDLCRNCFGPREDSMSKFEFELLEDSDEGADADDEETDEDCEIEDILVGEMPEDEIGEGVSKVAKENLAVTKSFKGLKMSEGQQELFQELLDTRKEDEDFETFLNSPLVESIKKDLAELNEQVDKAIEEKEKEKKEKEEKDLPAGSAGLVEEKKEEKEGAASTELPAGSAGLIQRRLTPMTSMLMHRTIESLNIGRLALEKKKVAQYIEEAEDEEEANRLEQRLREINSELEKQKDHMQKQDKESRKQVVKLTEETRKSQLWHDIRYFKAIEAGVPHGRAWAKEKKRRRAILHRKKGMPERMAEKLRNEELWLEEFRKKGTWSDKDYQSAEKMNVVAEGIETEVIEEGAGGLTIKGRAKKTEEFVDKRIRKALTKEEFESFREETKEDELKVMERKEIDIGFKKRKVTAERKKKRKISSKRRRKAKEPCGALAWHGSCHRGDACPFSHDVKDIQNKVCRFYVRSFCSRKNCPFLHSEEERAKYLAERDLKRVKEEEEEEERQHAAKQQEIAKPPVRKPPIEPPPRFTSSEVRVGYQTNPDDDELDRDVQWALWDAPWRRHRDQNEPQDRSPRGLNALSLASITEHEPKMTIAFDTGAAVTTIPEAMAKEIKVDGCAQKYRTASGELINDKGATLLLGQDERFNCKAIRGRVTEVRKILASGSAVCKHNVVMLNNEGGEIIPSGSKIAKHLEKELEKAKKWYPNEANSSTPLRVEKGVYVFDFWRNKETKDVNAVEGEAEAAADSAAASEPFRGQAKKL